MRISIIIFLILLAQLCSTKNAQANFFVLYEKASKEIVSVSNDAKTFIIGDADKDKLEVKGMSGELSDYEIKGRIQDYKISGDRIVVNTKKISDRVASEELAQEIAAEQKLIDNKLKDLAIDELKKDGIELKIIKK